MQTLTANICLFRLIFISLLKKIILNLNGSTTLLKGHFIVIFLTTKVIIFMQKKEKKMS